MKKIYLSFLVAMLSAFAFAQSFTLVTDSHPREVSTGPSKIVSNSSMLVYSGSGFHTWTTNFTYSDVQIWVSDGTEANTHMIQFNTASTEQVYLGTPYVQHASAGFLNEVNFKDKIYFQANNGKSNGVYTINSLSGDTVRMFDGIWSTPQFEANDNLIFKSGGLCQWDGVNAPVLIPNQLSVDSALLVTPNTYGTYLNGKYLFYGKLVTDNSAVAINTELFSLDPAGSNGPQLVKDINPSGASSIKHFVNHGEKVYFSAKGASGVATLWQTDGTTDGTFEVPEVLAALSTATSSSSGAFATNGIFLFKDKLYFEADDASHNDQLYRFDLNTKEVTRMTTLIKADGSGTAADFDPSNYVVCNDTLYFVGKFTYLKPGATTNSTTSALYKLNKDGNVEIIPDTYKYNNIDALCLFNNKIYMQAEDPQMFMNEDSTYTSSGKELFVYNPAKTNTAVNEINSDSNIRLSVNSAAGSVLITGLSSSNASYQIMDITGKRLSTGMIRNNTVQFNQKSGIYLMQIHDAGRSVVLKMIIQ